MHVPHMSMTTKQIKRELCDGLCNLLHLDDTIVMMLNAKAMVQL